MMLENVDYSVLQAPRSLVEKSPIAIYPTLSPNQNASSTSVG